MSNEVGDKVVLLVDDLEDDAVLFASVLRQVGLMNPIIWLRDGKYAIDYLSGTGEYANRDRSPFPSILVLDLKMPGRDGFSVLEWIREHPEMRNIFIVALSALEDMKSIRRAYELGAKSYLIKPVNRSDLAQLVQFFREFWIGPAVRQEIEKEDHSR
jgi:CheY-like chemotaxis protein